MASTITLTFNSNPQVSDDISVFVDTGTGIIELKETFVNLRQATKQVTTPDYSGGADLYDAIENYVTAWNLDHKNTGGSNNIRANQGFATIENPSNEVIITLENEAWQFGITGGALIDNGTVTVNLANQPIQNPKKVELTGFSAGTDPCANLNAAFDISGGNGTYRFYLDGSLVAENTSPISINALRGSVKSYSVTDELGVKIGSGVLRTPRKLLASDIELKVDNYQSGASISITIPDLGVSPLEYSLDGTEWRTANFFSGIINGNYTLHVRDKFGCVVTKDFIVDGATSLTETVFTISDINALHFAKAEGGKKNLENTLSCNENKPLTYPFYHRYLETDTITTQFKTNAQYIDAYTIDTKGNKKGLAPVQLTENIGLEAKSTATYFSLGGGRSAIYFGVIDILDVVTDEIKETVDLGFTLPEWANTKGQLVTIEGVGQIPIDAIGYSDFYDSFVLEFNVAYEGEPTTKSLYAQYNLQPYEVYEFEIYMANEAELFNVVIEAGATSTDIAYVSEKVKRVNDSHKLMEITYTDNQNKGDMVYQTGIVHKMRLEGLSDYIGEQETEGYNGDNGYNVTDNSIFKTERFLFPRLSSAMAHKLRLVMSHTILNINGIMYKIAESPEINTDINNNFKTFLVVLKSGGDLFLDSSQEIIGGSESESLSGALEASKGKSLLLWTKQNN